MNSNSLQNGRSHTRGFRRQRLYDIDRKAICEYKRSHPATTHYDIALFFSIDRSTVAKILKHKERWLNVNTEGQVHTGQNRMRSKKRRLKFPEIESQMEGWLHEFMSHFYAGLPTASLPDFSELSYDPLAPVLVQGPLRDAMLHDKAVEIARLAGFSEEDFKASVTWIDSFKSRQCIRNGFWGKYLPKNPPCGKVSCTYSDIDALVFISLTH